MEVTVHMKETLKEMCFEVFEGDNRQMVFEDDGGCRWEKPRKRRARAGDKRRRR